jgi:putative transcriptional regulator
MADEEAADGSWAGRLLVATPELTGPTFRRAVVLLLQHAPDDGALGVVISAASGTDVDEVLPGWQNLAAGPAQVFVGGPVGTDTALCLAEVRPGAAGPALALLPASPGLAVVDLDAVPADVAPLVQRLRVFAGSAGWAPGQLEGEVDRDAWWVVDAWPGDAFRPQPGALWRQVLRRQGGRLALASTWPDEPGLN